MLYFTTPFGESIEVKDWNDYNGIVSRMSCQINEKECIVLEGFEAYLRIKEEIRGVISPVSGTSKVILYGKCKDKVVEVTLDLIHNKISQEVKPFNKAYNNKPLNSLLWKRGVLSNPRVYKSN